jgi:hypothetical protein
MLLQDTDSAGRTQSTLLLKQGQILADKRIPPTGSAVFNGISIGCGVMVVSTLGFGVFEIFLEFSAHGSAVCNDVLLGCSVMVLVCPWFPPLGVVGTFVPFVTSFSRSAMSFCGSMAAKFGDIFKSHLFSGVRSGVHFDC